MNLCNQWKPCGAKTKLDTLPSSAILLHNLTLTQAFVLFFNRPAQHHFCVMGPEVQSTNKKYDFPQIPKYYLIIKCSVTALMRHSVQAKYLM